MSASVWPGRNWPLGSTWTEEATNFAVHAPDATAVWVCLFDEEDNETRVELREKALGIWHGEIPGVAVGTRYGYRADGPWDPAQGLRFNSQKLLLDPYAKAVSGELTYDESLFAYDMAEPDKPSELDSAGSTARSVVVHDDFDWGGDEPMRRRYRDSAIYELHVKGYTQLHDRIPEELRGTYAGLGHPVITDYLNDLGVTAVELLPVHQFFTEPSVAERGLVNYWGATTP